MFTQQRRLGTEHKYIMAGHHTTGYGRIQYVARAASKPDRDTSDKDTYGDTGVKVTALL